MVTVFLFLFLLVGMAGKLDRLQVQLDSMVKMRTNIPWALGILFLCNSQE